MLRSFPCCWGCCYVIRCTWAPEACTTLLLANIIIIVPSTLIILTIYFWSGLASRIKKHSESQIMYQNYAQKLAGISYHLPHNNLVWVWPIKVAKPLKTKLHLASHKYVVGECENEKSNYPQIKRHSVIHISARILNYARIHGPHWVWIRGIHQFRRWLMKIGKNHLCFFLPQNRCPNSLPSTHLFITTVGRNCLLTLGSFPCCWGCCYVIRCTWAPEACTTLLLANIIIIVPSTLIILMICFWSGLASRIKTHRQSKIMNQN